MQNLSENDTSVFNNQQPQSLPNATAVLVLGIVSIVTCFCYGVVGFVCGIIALVLSSKDRRLYLANPDWFTRSSYNNMKAGKTCAIIGLIMSGLYLAIIIVIIALVGVAAIGHPEEIMRRFQHY